MASSSRVGGRASNAVPKDKSEYDIFIARQENYTKMLRVYGGFLTELHDVQHKTQNFSETNALSHLDRWNQVWVHNFPSGTCPNITLQSTAALMKACKSKLPFAILLKSNCPVKDLLLNSGSARSATTRYFQNLWGGSFGLPLDIGAPVTARLHCRPGQLIESLEATPPANCCNHADPTAGDNVYNIFTLQSLLVATFLYVFGGNKPVLQCSFGAVARRAHGLPRHGRYEGVIQREQSCFQNLPTWFMREHGGLISTLIGSVYHDTAFAFPHPSRMNAFPAALFNARRDFGSYLIANRSPYNVPRDGVQTLITAVVESSRSWFREAVAASKALNAVSPQNPVRRSTAASPPSVNFDRKLDRFIQLVRQYNVEIDEELLLKLKNRGIGGVQYGGIREAAVTLGLDVALQFDWDDADDSGRTAIAMLPLLAWSNISNATGTRIELETEEHMEMKLGQILSFMLALGSDDLPFMLSDTRRASVAEKVAQERTLRRAIEICGTSTVFIRLLATTLDENSNRLSVDCIRTRIKNLNKHNTTVESPGTLVASKHPKTSPPSAEVIDLTWSDSDEDPPVGSKRKSLAESRDFFSHVITFLEGYDGYNFKAEESIPIKPLHDYLVAAGLPGVAEETPRDFSSRLHPRIKDYCVSREIAQRNPAADNLKTIDQRLEYLYQNHAKAILDKHRAFDKIALQREAMALDLPMNSQYLAQRMMERWKNGVFPAGVGTMLNSPAILDLIWDKALPILEEQRAFERRVDWISLHARLSNVEELKEHMQRYNTLAKLRSVLQTRVTKKRELVRSL